MGHEITSTDTVGIVGSTGWHGLGKDISAGQSALEALESLGLDWQVIESNSMTANFGGTVSAIDTHKALLRSDTSTVLGVVADTYSVIQNRTLASLADSMGKDESGAVSVDSAGSLAGGKKVWIALRGSDTVIGGDEAYQYLLLANSHDGSSSLRIHPTMTRVVCANTYAGSASDERLGYGFRHTSGLAMRIDEIRAMLSQWRTRLDSAKREADELASIAVNTDRVQQIFVAVHEATVGYEIPTNPTSRIEENRKRRAVEALAYMGQVFDLERSQGCQPSAWLAAQATTNWIQKVHGILEGEQRVASMVWGGKAADSAKAIRIAQQVVG